MGTIFVRIVNLENSVEIGSIKIFLQEQSIVDWWLKNVTMEAATTKHFFTVYKSKICYSESTLYTVCAFIMEAFSELAKERKSKIIEKEKNHEELN